MRDYVVIGSGSAGSVLAARLSEDPTVSVTLLEAGDEDKSVLIHCPAGLALMAKQTALNWAMETVAQSGLNGRKGYQPRGKVLGGSSSINAMIYARGQPADYEYWSAQGNTGWGWIDVLPYFQKAECNSKGADAWHGGSGPLHVSDLRDPNPLAQAFVQAGVQAGHVHNLDFNGPSQEGVGLYQVTHHNGERCSAAKAYLTLVRNRPNLQVITSAQVLRVLMEGRKAVGVEYVQGGKVQQLSCSREVLLCAGALQSPQLLMLSGIGPADHLQRQGINVVHNLPGVGEHLHDHPDVMQVVSGAQLTDSFGISLTGLKNVCKGVEQWRNGRRGMLTSNFAEAGGFIRSQSQEGMPDLQLHFVVGKLLDHGRKTVLGHGYSCHVCILQPKSRGRVRLASNDARTMPLIDPAFFAEPDDMQRMVRGVHRMREILNQPALASLGGKELAHSARARSDAEIEQFIRNYGDTIYHPVGSCRMGPGPLDVVDAQLRVHGVQGLRVVDASIMPRIVSGNTNAPTIMIAEKAADLIKSQL
ncbi:choline dehydrogenase [Comamonas sp. Y33R10-2]|uniref:GMC family oxidoreductase n=1 Tax=Comamonas sp. Y33R10-2 TaxID=2853257 RepID=UPI001C5C9ACE|nr:choline dehydrogenase [Comamonas sp. Y33R10-2]QXZ09237.1 choline dehydrogenase [Comamonas sp. Y33R10-2]